MRCACRDSPAPDFLPASHIQLMVQPLKRPVISPKRKIVVDRADRRQVLWHIRPLNPRPPCPCLSGTGRLPFAAVAAQCRQRWRLSAEIARSREIRELRRHRRFAPPNGEHEWRFSRSRYARDARIFGGSKRLAGDQGQCRAAHGIVSPFLNHWKVTLGAKTAAERTAMVCACSAASGGAAAGAELVAAA